MTPIKIKAAPGPNGTPHPTPAPKWIFRFFEFRPRDLSHENRAEILCRGMQSVCQMEPYVSRNARFRFCIKYGVGYMLLLVVELVVALVVELVVELVVSNKAVRAVTTRGARE